MPGREAELAEDVSKEGSEHVVTTAQISRGSPWPQVSPVSVQRCASGLSSSRLGHAGAGKSHIQL